MTWSALVTAFLTAFYIFRVIFVAFWGESRDRKVTGHAHESPSIMTTPLVILAVFSVLAGYIGIPGGLSLMEPYLDPVLQTPGVIRVAAEGNPLEWVLLLVSVIVALGGIYLAYYMYVLKPSVSKALVKRYEWLYTLLQNKYYVDQAYMEVIVKPLRDLGTFAASVLDRGVVDGIVNGVGSFTAGSGVVLARLQGGLVRAYALSILLGVAAILGYLVLR